MNESVAELLAQSAEVSTRAAQTAAAGDIETALRLDREADALRRRARLSAQRQSAPVAATTGSGTVRDMTIAALNELEVPSAPKALSDYARVRFDFFLNHRVLTSMRRDELRAWRSLRSHRPVYVVPALEGRRFLAVRGKLALSSWPLGRRLIGPWSERVDYLRATLNLVAQYEWLVEHDREYASRLSALLERHATSIPGALGGAETDIGRVRRAAETELAQLEPHDEDWRGEAADRAARLPEEQQLFGAPPPTALSGSAG